MQSMSTSKTKQKTVSDPADLEAVAHRLDKICDGVSAAFNTVLRNGYVNPRAAKALMQLVQTIINDVQAESTKIRIIQKDS